MSLADLLLHRASKALIDTFLKTPTHAVLLEGPSGIGKTQIAQGLAVRLLQSDSRKLPYIRTISPEKDSIGIGKIRELISFFQLKVPGKQAIRRVAIITDADRMGAEAQNALLKMLEEPPADSVLILTSSRPQSLLLTIRSRLQALHLPAPTPTQIKQFFLLQPGGYTEAAIDTAILRAGTNVGMVSQLLSDELDGSAVDLIKKVLAGTTYERLLYVDSLAKQKDTVHEFVDTLASVAMASLQAAAAKGGAVKRWQAILQAASIAQDALERSGNTKLVLAELMLTL